MDPCDFSLFPELKRPIEERKFATKKNFTEELKTIPKSVYQKCLEDWKKHWQKFIISEGDYFEGDNIDIDG